MNIPATWRVCHIYRKPGRRPKAAGQALVELTLALTFLTYLFAAAVDLGLAYKSYQTLINATAEASSFLAIKPAISCGAGTTAQCAREAADREARVRFRGEQGMKIRGFAGSTMDLNADEKNDAEVVPSGFANFEQFIRAKVQIKVADDTQVVTSNSDFGIGGNFIESTDPSCLQRAVAGAKGQCYIVVQTEIIYRPFAIAPAVGETMTIRAISVKPIVQ